jgi:hypothetical protein
MEVLKMKRQEIRKTILGSLLGVLSLVYVGNAQEIEEVSAWKNTVVGSLNFASNTYSNSWTKGGEENINTTLNVSAQSEFDDATLNWLNKGKLEYGQTKAEGQGFRKSLDKILLESFLTYKWGIAVNPYVGATVESQISTGYVYPEAGPRQEVSWFFNPAFLTQSIGLGYQPKTDVAKILSKLGFGLKESYVTDLSNYEADWTVDPGLEGIINLEKTFRENLLFTSDLTVFSNFKGLDEVDVRWNNQLNVIVSKYIKLTVDYEALKDVDTGTKAWQWKNITSIGLSYSFL